MRFNSIIAVKHLPGFTEEQLAGLKNIAPFVARLPECRIYTDAENVEWVAVQVSYETLADIEALQTMLLAREADQDSLTAAAGASAKIKAKVGKKKADALVEASAKKGEAGVKPVGLWDVESIGENGEALQQGYALKWDETIGDDGEVVRSNYRAEKTGEKILMPFDLALYLNMQADDVTYDAEGVELARTRPTTARQFNVFSGFPRGGRDLELRV